MELDDLYKIVSSASGVSVDTRSLKQGDLFMALRGPNFDGNRYARQAVECGAVAAIADDPDVKGDRIIIVDDVLETLSLLAAMHRKKMDIPVIAITGTNGKTTTKELIAAVLAQKGKVHFTPGNLNNHIGLPLTILNTPRDTNYLIVEMGANHKGEIASLCEIANPTHGLITNIGKAHLEGFGSFEGVINTKSELYQWLRKTGGIVFYDDNNSLLKELVFHIPHKAVPYSDPAGTDLVVRADEDNAFTLNVSVGYEEKSYSFATELFGSYNVDNVRAAIAVGIFFEVPVDDIFRAISSYRPSNNRSQIRNTGRNILICDSYNANPSSMLKAIRAFNNMKAERKMVILGDMFELGSESVSEHQTIIEELKKLDGITVVLVGTVFSSVAGDAGLRSFASTVELAAWLKDNAPEKNTILVKGSRGMKLESVYELL